MTNMKKSISCEYSDGLNAIDEKFSEEIRLSILQNLTFRGFHDPYNLSYGIGDLAVTCRRGVVMISAEINDNKERKTVSFDFHPYGYSNKKFIRYRNRSAYNVTKENKKAYLDAINNAIVESNICTVK